METNKNDQVLTDRYQRQIDVKFAERARVLHDEVRRIDASSSANGTFQSSRRVLQIHGLFKDELDVRAKAAWECLVRAQQVLGVPASETLRETLKSLISESIQQISAELDAMCQNEINRSQILSTPTRMGLGEALRVVLMKHDVEVDLYIDALMSKDRTMAAVPGNNYNFYGPVGAFQTGAGSAATVAQTIGDNNKEALLRALELVRDAIRSAESLGEKQRQDLLEVAAECSQQVTAPEPNVPKMHGLFSVLTTAIQTIPNAVPAYEALRSALAAFGTS